MARVTRVAAHLTVDEVIERIKQTTGFWRVQKWIAILHSLTDPMTAEQIAKHTGLAKQTVSNLISAYNRLGPSILDNPGKGGRRNSYMTEDEELAFLQLFTPASTTGQIATVREIHRAYEQEIGRRVCKTTIYRLLKRHGWRKVVPRASHVESSPEKQDIFKKHLPKG